ncbi:MAG: UDP-glucose 4-epimerase GalE [Bacteroidales bacterium]|nr:UDP-glucose 4-epimerase GalE [Bacteroidales bacterium]MCF8389194.1 UDP-glucose 4-epimerase GalE [Bacteroidales bacterium]
MILVTGGTGFIGSHTSVELLREGFEVLIADNLSNSYADVIDRIEEITGKRPFFERTDLSNSEETDLLFEKYPKIEAIIHFAASKAVGESVEKPLLYYKNNLNSLMNILENMKRHSVKNLVFSSSCTVYGEPDELPVHERSPIKIANSPYGNTKQISEEIIQDVAKVSSEINFISLRYFNPIGAHPSALIGELPLGIPNNLIPYITQTGYGLREALKVFGDDYNTPDGSAIRDYIDVVDLSRAHIISIKRLLNHKNKANFEIFNLGTGTGSSVFEVIRTFEKVCGQKINFKVVGRREGDIEKVWADTRYANEELGWKAEKTLGQSLKTAWDWENYYRKNLEKK